MSNIYHILPGYPALTKSEMYVELEALAENIVRSGRLRIDADNKMNFVRFSLPSAGIHMMFSYRELFDDQLLPFTKNALATALAKQYPKNQIAHYVNGQLERLRKEIKKYQPIDADVEMKLARVITQTAHPAVILLMLWERTEIYISFSHTVGDMLDMRSWQTVGSSGGLQSTDTDGCAVFVSCGGDPFVELDEDEEPKNYGDGFPALARLMIIGGQELGHYADIIRDSQGNPISRHSANLSATRAKENVRQGRLKDLLAINTILTKISKFQFQELLQLEKEMHFYKKHNSKGLTALNNKRKVNNLTRSFIKKCRRHRLSFLVDIAAPNGVASQIAMLVADMRFNLAPIADAYKRDNPVEEEAIACVEALARVPQQANKWGHNATERMMPNLYKIYYGQVIPACIKSYEQLSGNKYNRKFTKRILPAFEDIVSFFRKK